MSRRSNANNNNGAGGAGDGRGAASSVTNHLTSSSGSGPPSHPSEQNPMHRAFLIRSLERNDVDMAALMELNHSLESVKVAILRTCAGGELTLLNLGEGRLTLDPEGETLQKSDDDVQLPEEGQELCVDFLLRMKLRRKLLNRLARRLNRVAHAMDGADVEPPGPPKYGDLRLHVDPHEVQAFAELSARQDLALRTMELQREQQSMEASIHRQPRAPTTTTTTSAELGTIHSADEKDTLSDENLIMETNPPEPGPEVIKSHREPESTTMDGTGAAVSTPSSPLDVATPDYEVLRSYDHAYEKVVDAKTGTFKFTVLDRPTEVEEDYVKIRYGAGIGAVHRSMSIREKEAEFVRWQTSLLNRIPDQPTFQEVGIENRVFLLHERRAKALKEEEERKAANIEKDAKDEVAGCSDTESAQGDGTTGNGEKKSKKGIDNGDNSDDESEARKVSDKEASAPSDVDDMNPSKDQNEHEVLGSKNAKAISLAAVPSFFEQDLKRIKLIHLDLMTSNMHDHARKRLEEVTVAYNNALRRSSELNCRREQLDLSLQKVVYQIRSTVDSRKGDSAVDIWAKAKFQYEDKQLNELLPSRWGTNPTGTVVTQQYGRQPNVIAQYVAHCLADVVDSIELNALEQIPKMQLYPHPRPAVEPSHADVLRKLEAQIREELAAVIATLRRSEEERNRAWKKMLKTKAEFDLPHQSTSLPSYTSASARPKVPLNMSNYHQVPLPTLRTSIVESVPQEVATSRPALASYVPQRSHVAPSVQEANDSRYSAARVKERIASDGTVAPVSEPKRSKDGLFLRPAGRTRKGMQWDAVRGIWVPAANGADE